MHYVADVADTGILMSNYGMFAVPLRNMHVYFLKEFFCHEPYGKCELYKHMVETAALEKLAKLIYVRALPLQTKVHMFWQILNDVF